VIEGFEDAEAYRFLGSPTVRVNGPGHRPRRNRARRLRAEVPHLLIRGRSVAAAAGRVDPRGACPSANHALGAVAALMLARVTDRSFATSVLATGRGSYALAVRTRADERNAAGRTV
jgi:hypothetical protein